MLLLVLFPASSTPRKHALREHPASRATSQVSSVGSFSAHNVRPWDVYRDADGWVERGRSSSRGVAQITVAWVGKGDGGIWLSCGGLQYSHLWTGVRQTGPGRASSQRSFLFGNHTSRQPCYDISIYQQQKWVEYRIQKSKDSTSFIRRGWNKAV